MSKFRALFHQTVYTKVFIFVTAQCLSNLLVTEFFYVVRTHDGKTQSDEFQKDYEPDVLSGLNLKDPIEFGLDEATKQAKNKVEIIVNRWYQDEGELPPNFGQINLSAAKIATLARYLLEEKYFFFIYKTKNKELTDYIQKAFSLKSSFTTVK